jgi:hypothetical protein
MTALILCGLFLIPVGSIAWDITRVEVADRTVRDIARLTAAELPPERDALLPEDWRTPLCWTSPTGQFWAIVEQLGDLWAPCTHCATPEDGEPAHAGCPGCCCPCALVGVA